MSQNNVTSPEGTLLWHEYCYEPDLKYPHRSGSGYYSITLNTDKQNRTILMDSICKVIGENNKGSVFTKSSGDGNTDWKFKCISELKDRRGNPVNQKPFVKYKDEHFTANFEQAIGRVVFEPKLYKAYNKTALLLKGILITSLADPDTPTREEADEALVNELSRLSGTA